jgi:hypothetical protein
MICHVPPVASPVAGSCRTKFCQLDYEYKYNTSKYIFFFKKEMNYFINYLALETPKHYYLIKLIRVSFQQGEIIDYNYSYFNIIIIYIIFFYSVKKKRKKFSFKRK